MRNRSALSIQRDVVFAIFLRDLRERFSGYALGNVWLILEPLLLLSAFVVIIGARGGDSGDAEAPVFLLAGMTAFRQLWQPTMQQVSASLKGYRSLRMFRQISIFDLMFARALMQAGVFFLVTCILLIGLIWFGYNAWPEDPLMVLLGAFFVWMLGFGCGLIFAVSQYFGPEVDKLVKLLQMPLFLISAVIYPMSAIPAPYRDILAYNPMAQGAEWFRQYWIASYTSPVLDQGYLVSCAIIVMAFGLSALRLTDYRELPK